MIPLPINAAWRFQRASCGFVLGAAIVAAIAQPLHAGEQLTSLTVSYNTSTCRPPDANKDSLKAPVVAILEGLSKGAEYQRVLPVGSSPGPFVATFNVVPDAYYVQGRQDKTNCIPSAGIVEVVLPGHPVSVKVDLTPCCFDDLAYSYLAGFVSPGVEMQILRSPTKLACGSTLDGSSLQPLQGADSVSRRGNAYYAEISQITPGTLVMRLDGRGSTAFILLELKPNGVVSITSTFRRLDVNEGLLEQASAIGGALFCLAS